MNPDTPSSLPAVDRIEIVDLSGLNISAGSGLLIARNRIGTAVDADETKTIANLWRDLPVGKQARCHIPPFAFRFYANDVLVQEASVCWRCNNIYGTSDGRRLVYEFDSESGAARELLQTAQRVTGIRVSE